MQHTPNASDAGLAVKIARLVQERGWNQEDFARHARLNRHTARQILQAADGRKLRNATVLACARALGLSVHELRSISLDRLLPRMRSGASESDPLRRLNLETTQPELAVWVERNFERARLLDASEVDELLALQGPNGPLATLGVERTLELIARKRRLHQRVDVIAGSDLLPLLDQFVGLLYDKVRPERGATS